MITASGPDSARMLVDHLQHASVGVAELAAIALRLTEPLHLLAPGEGAIGVEDVRVVRNEQVREDVLRAGQCRDLVEAIERVEGVLAQDAPVPRVGGRGLGLVERAQQGGLGQDGGELVLPLVPERSIGVDVRGGRRPPVGDVDVLVAELLERGRHHQVVAQHPVDRLAILALGRLRLERIGVEVVQVQRAGERERRLDVVGVRMARDAESARLEGGEEGLVVELVGLGERGSSRRSGRG